MYAPWYSVFLIFQLKLLKEDFCIQTEVDMLEFFVSVATLYWDGLNLLTGQLPVFVTQCKRDERYSGHQVKGLTAKIRKSSDKE